MNKIQLIATVLMCSIIGSLNAQNEFILKDRFSDFETEDGKNYSQIYVTNGTNSIETIVSDIYTVLAITYPRANIQLIGNSIIRIDATSSGIAFSSDPRMDCFIDFSVMIEVKEHPDPVSYVDSTGTTRVYIGDEPCVRVYAPVVKKMTFYNPYYKSDVKVYRTDKYEMNDVLFMSNPYMKQLGPEYTIAHDFLSEIDVYIIGNIYRKINHEGEVILKKK